MFHLHGNSMYVVGSRQLDNVVTAEEIIRLEEEGQLLLRNVTKPIRRDSVAVPDRGVLAFRFQATNPGNFTSLFITFLLAISPFPNETGVTKKFVIISY